MICAMRGLATGERYIKKEIYRKKERVTERKKEKEKAKGGGAG